LFEDVGFEVLQVGGAGFAYSELGKRIAGAFMQVTGLHQITRIEIDSVVGVIF